MTRSRLIWVLFRGGPNDTLLMPGVVAPDGKHLVRLGDAEGLYRITDEFAITNQGRVVVVEYVPPVDSVVVPQSAVLAATAPVPTEATGSTTAEGGEQTQAEPPDPPPEETGL